MKTKILLLALAFASVTPALHAKSESAKTITIIATDSMKFSVTKIEATPGQKLVVVLKNEGAAPKDTMGHNWILLNAGADPGAYANAAISAKAQAYQPKSLAGQVLASIPILGPKESANTTFTAPKTPGSYPYLCSFPAHFQAGMRGVLIVK
jgi:azurin